MAGETKTVNVQGIGFYSLLGIVFITLKLCGVIAWPWLWVTAPLWIPPAVLLTLAAVLLLCCGLVLGVAALINLANAKQ